MTSRMKKKMWKWNGKRIVSIGLALALLFANMDVTAFAMEPDGVEQRQESEQQETPTDVSDGAEGGKETSDSGEEKVGEDTQKPDEGNGGEEAQNPDEGNVGDNAQNPDEGDEEDNAQNPDEEGKENNTQNPDGEDGVTDDTGETPDISEEEETADTEEVDSVSENDMEAQGEVHTLAVSGDAIVSGIYGNITWMIDANGKLKVEGTGDFASSTSSDRAPWTRYDIKSAEINVTGMTDASYMFFNCSNMTDVTFEGSDTSLVKSMKSMFFGCNKLESINWGQNFDTSAVTDMSRMFECCYSIGDLNLSGWDTSQVTTMASMFMDCDFDHLTLDGSFTTKNVKTLVNMFAWYRNNPNEQDYVKLSTERIKLKEVDLSWLDLSNKPILSGIFEGCDVRELDLSRLDTSVTTTLQGLFEGCDMTGVDFSDLKTDTITNMDSMFRDCTGTIDLHTLKHENVTNMGFMFAVSASDNRWISLDLSELNTTKATNMASMFRGQDKLIDLDLSGFDVGNVENMNCMFIDCNSLRSLDLSGWNTDKVKYVTEMFKNCPSLTELDLSGLNFKNVTLSSHLSSMGIDTCTSLNTIYTPYNVKGDVPLPAGDWYMADGTKLEDNCLPKNLSYSVLIQKGSVPSVSAARMEVSKKKTLYACGETIGTDDLTVTYYGTDGSVRKLTEEEYATNAASLDTTEPGTLELVITCNMDGKTLTGKITLTVAHILSADNTVITLPSEAGYDYTYDGQPKMPKPVTVSYTKKNGDGTETPVTLTEGTDYTVSYRNNIDAYEKPVEGGAGDGTDTATAAVGSTAAAPTVIVKGTGGYSGTATQTFSIKKALAPAAEEKTIVASQCTQARPDRTIDLSDSFADFGKKTGYEVVSVEDTKNIFSRTPATADIKNGVLTYGTNAAQEDDTASITVRVSFANYKDAELTVKIVMASKKRVVISGITMPEDTTYAGAPVTYDGTASVTAEDGTDVTGQVTLVYSYSGMMADGTAYPESSGASGSGPQVTEPPVNAGSYVLTVAVAEDDEEYTGSTEYPFTISPVAVTVKAGDIVDMTQGNQEATKPVTSYQSEFKYDTEGLLNDDTLDKEPVYTVTDTEGQAVTQIDMTKEGIYYIVPSGADAGMNYAISYVSGTLTVTEERVVYTVRFDCMGHGSSFVKSGIKAGSLLELSEEELAPEAEGYLFAGWYQDKTFDSKSAWNFDTDTVQSDLTLYACWLTAAAEDGNGLKLCVQEILDLTYTGSALKPAVTVYDSDGKTILKAGRDYTIKYANNTNAVKTGENGEPEQGGGTAKVENPSKANEKITDVIGRFSKECPYVVITGKGNYTETVYRNFRILPADIAAAEETGSAKDADDTPLATGFTLKYTDQFEAKAGKTAKIVSSLKYKKALKEGSDYEISVLQQDTSGTDTPVTLTQGKLPLNAGNYALIIKGCGNYTGTVRRSLYVADKQKLMKNASVTYVKTIKAAGAEALKKGIEQMDVKVKIGGNVVDAANYTIDYAGTNHAVGTATMTITGTNGYVGSKSVTFKIMGMPFSAKTVEVKAYDTNQPNEKDWKASMPYTGRAVTQNKVTLTAKATNDNPNARNLVYGDDYTITYKNNVKKGTATMNFTANPKSGFSGSFKKTFKIDSQNLSADMFVEKLPDGTFGTGKWTLEIVSTDTAKHNVTVKWGEDAVHSAGGASPAFQLKNAEGMELKQGADYTVSYKDNKAATKESADSAVKTGSRQPVMTIKGKGNYAGTLTVQFQIIPAAIDSAQLTVTAAQVQKKNGMKLQDFKLKVTDGKTTLKAGTDYIVDDTGCTTEIIKAYADSLGTAGTPPEPKLVLTGIGNYGAKAAEGEGADSNREISLADYIYATKLTAKNIKIEVTGDRTYTGQNIEPTVKVSYYKDNNATKQGASGVELTEGTDYKVTYGSKNIPAGKKKGSITVTGAGVYGGSVTVKFDIERKQIY